MCPEYGATVAIFPIDDMTLDYLRLTGRDPEQVALVEAYAQARRACSAPTRRPMPVYAETHGARSGDGRAEPGRPAPAAGSRAASASQGVVCVGAPGSEEGREDRWPAPAAAPRSPPRRMLDHGSVVIAAITSCTNTSNPSVMIGAGLVAKKAVEKGLQRKPWVKTSLAPGSKVVTDY